MRSNQHWRRESATGAQTPLDGFGLTGGQGAIAFAVLAIAYIAAAALGYSAGLVHTHVAPVWPASGLAIAALTLWGLRLWPAVLLGAFVAAFTLGANSFGVAAGVACGNTVEALLGAWALRRLGVCGEIAGLKDAAALLAVALLAPLASMAIGVVTLALASAVPGGNFAVASLYWWLAHALGTFIVLPPVLAWAGQPVSDSYVRRRVEFAGATALIVTLTSLAYWHGGALKAFGVPFLPPAIFLFPPLVWALMRLRPRETSFVMAAGFSLTVIFALAGGATGAMGPLIFLALVLLIVGGGWLLLFGVIAERTRTSQQSQQTLGRLMEAQRIGKIGDWDFDLATGSITWSPQTFEVLGRDPSLGPPQSYEENAAIYEPASAALMAEKVAAAITSGEAQEYELVAIRPDGLRVPVQAMAVPRKDGTGKVVSLNGTVQDVSAGKRAEWLMRESEERLSFAMEASAIGDWDLDLRTNVTRRSLRHDQCFGYAEMLPEWSYETFLAHIEPADRDRVDASFQKAMAGQGAYDEEFRAPWPDGSEHWLWTKGRFYFDEAGQPYRVAGIVVDITERKLAETSLREKDSLLRVAGRMAHFGGWSVNLADGKQLWSDEVARIHDEPPGYCPSVSDGVNYYAPEWREKIAAVFGDCVSHGTPYDEEMQIITARGRRVWVRAIGAAVRDATGTIIQVQGAFHDITERKQAENMARQSHDLLANLARLVPGVVYQYRLFPDGRSAFPYASPGMNDIYEVTPAEVREDATPVFGRLHPDDYGRVVDLIQESARTLQTFYCEFRVILPRQGLRWRWSHAQPERMEDGGTLWHGFIADITDRKRAEEDVRRLNAELEQRVIERTAELQSANAQLQTYSTTVSNALRAAENAEQTKARFLATMSHELRTPLNSIIGFTDVLREGLAGPVNPEQTKQLTIVQGSARHLLALINDVLDISKIEAGRVEIRMERFDLHATIKRVTASIQPLAENKGLTLTVVVAPTVTEIVSDRLRVEQILLNLLSNAVKFTERGGVTLTVDTVAVEMFTDLQSASGLVSHTAVRVRVGDTGMGVKPEELATLFEAFRQAEGGRARASEGTGLGLAISRRLATLLGGEVSAVSEWGTGSTFTLILPLVEESEAVLEPSR